MKKTITYAALLLAGILYLSSCTRSLSPYEAAQGTYKKCRRVR